jgi:hypothetical protein
MSPLHFSTPSTRLKRLAILCAAVPQLITLDLRKEERRLRNIQANVSMMTGMLSTGNVHYKGSLMLTKGDVNMVPCCQGEERPGEWRHRKVAAREHVQDSHHRQSRNPSAQTLGHSMACSTSRPCLSICGRKRVRSSTVFKNGWRQDTRVKECDLALQTCRLGKMTE